MNSPRLSLESHVKCKKKRENVSCLPTEHQGVQRTRSEISVHSRIELEFGSAGFKGEGKTGVLGRGEKHLTPGPGIEPWTHWWEESTLTTKPVSNIIYM